MIFVGHIKDAVSYLASLVTSTDDIEAATPEVQSTIHAAAKALVDALDPAIRQLDSSAPFASGLAPIASGCFAPDAVAQLEALDADHGQLLALLDMRGFAGRVLTNVEQAAGYQ